MQKQIVFLTSLLLAFTVLAACQDKKPASPPAQAQCKFSDGKTINIAYSSPRAKGRKIFGGLVPYGEVWRTGANEATTFVTDADVNRRRQRCSRRQLHHLYPPQRRQVDPDRQQENRRMGHSL